MKPIALIGTVFWIAASAQIANAAPNGGFNLQVQTKFPWPIAASISGDKLKLKSQGRTKIVGATRTKGASKNKISGTVNFSTIGTGGREGCNQKSTVTVTLKFDKDGIFKSGAARGKCVRDNGKSGSFSGKVQLK